MNDLLDGQTGNVPSDAVMYLDNDQAHGHQKHHLDECQRTQSNMAIDTTYHGGKSGVVIPTHTSADLEPRVHPDHDTGQR